MDSTTYSVILRLSTEGTLAARDLQNVGARGAEAARALGQVAIEADGTGRAMVAMGGKAGDALDWVANKAVDVGVSLAKWGSIAIAGAATYGVAKLNNELEQTEISLGAIAQAQGFAKTFEQGFAMAGDQLAKMKQDVKTLPGDLGQLSDIMKMIATPAAHAKASMDEIRQLAGKTMLTSAILGVPQEVAAREMAGLLAGRAGSHNILGGRLGLIGDEAKRFNAESPEERLKRINVEMAKYQGAANKFSTSFVAQWTTLKDNIKYTLLAPATSPLFERVKVTIGEINSYFDGHKTKIAEIVSTVSGRLVSAWNEVEGSVKRIVAVAGPFLDRLVHMQPAEIGKHIEGAARGVLELKLGAGALKLLPSVGGALGAESALGAAGALGAVAVAAVPLAGILDNLTDSSRRYHDQDVILLSQLGKQAEEFGHRLVPAGDALRTFADKVGHEALVELNTIARDVNASAELAKQAGSWFSRLSEQLESFDDTLIRERFRLSRDIPGPIKEHEADLPLRLLSSAAIANIGRTKTESDAEKDKSKLPPIRVNAQVTINVQSNQDPQRIAELVKFRLEKGIYETASRHVPNYGRP